MYSLITITTFLLLLSIISSGSWVMAWLLLELMSMIFIPMGVKTRMSSNCNAFLSYYCIQAIASAILLYTLSGVFDVPNLEMGLFLLAVLVKLGTFPFIVWTMQIVNSLSSETFFLFLTMVKMAPLMVVMMLPIETLNSFFLLYLLGTFTPLLLLSNKNKFTFRMLLTISSINHYSWMLLALMKSKVYFTLMVVLYLMSFYMFFHSVFQHSQSGKAFESPFPKSASMWYKVSFMSNSMNVWGFPPMIMFTPKVLVVKEFLEGEEGIFSLVLLLSSVVSLYIYFSMIYPMMVLSCKSYCGTMDLYTQTMPEMVTSSLMVWIIGVSVWVSFLM